MLLDFFTYNLTIIFFVYGLAFYVMGVSILIQPRKEESSFKLSEFVWLLGAFGISHGINEWLDMFILATSYDLIIWREMRLALLTVSFVFLFEFGLRLNCFKTRFFDWRVTLFMCAVTAVFIFTSGDEPAIWTRYFLTLPAGLLSAFGFFRYYRENSHYLKKFNVGKYFLWASASVGVYAVLAGVIVPKGSFFPASLVNNTSFLKFFGIPVEIFRAICAIILSRAVWNILHIFNREIILNLKDSLEKLAHSENLAAMGKFAGIMGHEFRNQLSVMKSSLYFLKMKFGDGDNKTKKHLERLDKQIAEANTIIEDILMFAKSRQIDFKDVDIRNILLTTVSSVQKDEKIKVITEIDKNLPHIKGDEIKLGRCFWNIVLNAVQAMDGAGKLLVSADTTGNFVNILFKDTGCGIKPDDMERVFDPFFSTKKGGTGLGLAICRTVIGAHNGIIDIKSEFDKGTTVKITLPIVQN
ncbi:MAG: HAMP domain-containing sensor histidine kinase [bacterium]